MNDLQNAFIYIKPKQPEPVARVFGRPLSPLARLFRAVRGALFGHEFTCWHMDADGDVKVFHCKTFADAMDWVDCALNDSRVWVVDRRGSLVAVRHPVRSPRHDLYVRRAGAKPVVVR